MKIWSLQLLWMQNWTGIIYAGKDKQYGAQYGELVYAGHTHSYLDSYRKKFFTCFPCALNIHCALNTLPFFSICGARVFWTCSTMVVHNVAMQFVHGQLKIVFWITKFEIMIIEENFCSKLLRRSKNAVVSKKLTSVPLAQWIRQLLK